MNHRDLIRLALMLIVLSLNAVLAHYAFENSSYSPLLGSISLASYAVICIAVILIADACLCGRRTEQQRHPRLCIENVMIHVYGLGLIIFVTIYSVVGVSGDATAMFYIQLTGFALEDMFVRKKDPALRRSVLLFAVILAGVSNVCSALSMPSAGEIVQALLNQDWFLVIYGGVLPCVVPWVFFGVRGKRFYNPVTIYDFIHFGMPFAVIMSVSCLVTFDSMWHRDSGMLLAGKNATHHTNSTIVDDNDRLITTADIATPLLCLNMLPTVFLAIQSTLLYSLVDFITVAAVVASFKSLTQQQPNTWVIIGFVAASLAFSARIYACYRDQDDKCSVVYSRETEEDEEEDEMIEKIRCDIQISADA
jgi:hypothetical protein